MGTQHSLNLQSLTNQCSLESYAGHLFLEGVLCQYQHILRSADGVVEKRKNKKEWKKH